MRREIQEILKCMVVSSQQRLVNIFNDLYMELACGQPQLTFVDEVNVDKTPLIKPCGRAESETEHCHCTGMPRMSPSRHLLTPHSAVR